MDYRSFCILLFQMLTPTLDFKGKIPNSQKVNHVLSALIRLEYIDNFVSMETPEIDTNFEILRIGVIDLAINNKLFNSYFIVRKIRIIIGFLLSFCFYLFEMTELFFSDEIFFCAQRLRIFGTCPRGTTGNP